MGMAKRAQAASLTDTSNIMARSRSPARPSYQRVAIPPVRNWSIAGDAGKPEGPVYTRQVHHKGDPIKLGLTYAFSPFDPSSFNDAKRNQMHFNAVK